MTAEIEIEKENQQAGRLACNDGTPVRTTPWPPWPVYSEDEVEAAAGVLRSGKVNYWTGQECKAFEREFAAHCGVAHALSLMNGSVALELALHALGIGEGDEVVVTPRSFMASVSCVVMRGARPVFADVDRDSGNITADTVRAVLSDRTRAVIPVHLGGWPCDMDPLMELAEERGLKVIEDCAQAHGATYKGRPVGGIGHMGAFSFCQDKIMTTGGEGGMLVTENEDLWKRAWSFKDHGKDFDTVFHTEHPPGFRWLHKGFGTNWRMTEMQAAIGRVQLRKLSETTRRRQSNARILMSRLSALAALRVPAVPDDLGHASYKLHVYLRPERLKHDWDKQRIMTAVTAEGVPCLSGSCSEIYREEAFEGNGLRPPEALPVARELGETSLMFLLHPTAEAADMEDICQAVEKVMAVATRD